ncbi:peptidoglycan DD-metalloendopeptidase family protein [Tabrizicola sp.]|uniref:peptidoglycan DD-metalloendopeptidase family protein n=1 Tax=Tabrizicola sp. TaxID=2005166 RepID=UPI0035B4D10C
MRISLDRLRPFGLGASLLALTACMDTRNLDWDMRAGGGDTSDAARQATAAAPMADANGILSYPDYQLAKARRGDTVVAMAGRLGLNAEALARSNALRPTDPLREGEMLLLPSRVSATPQPAAIASGGISGGGGPIDISSIATTALDAAGPTPVAASPAASKPISGQPLTHRVARGETAFTIARTYNVSAKALADWNQLGADMAVREGQTLIIPIATAPAPDPEPVPTPPGSGSPTPEPPSAAKPLPDEKPEVAATKPKATPPSPDLGEQATAASAARMAMPVAGKIIRGYDRKSNQGIDISAAAGAPVKAADAGTVTVISSDTTGKGIVILRHANNLLTVYVGVGGVSVKKGDKVGRGQSIGTVAAGNPAFLHFEVRNTSKESFDPMTYLQ